MGKKFTKMHLKFVLVFSFFVIALMAWTEMVYYIVILWYPTILHWHFIGIWEQLVDPGAGAYSDWDRFW
ncbi:hypothetical protein XELAEV_18009843mg [Xenopus laevis]|uniref:Uncharacterized protein n=1 Tax=Xenopus laevis TaxID=8355 RepID=A0A974DTF9_XENLA|nr:hypothetical protein XELAEV_18009843mg [Xenopus laevis]